MNASRSSSESVNHLTESFAQGNLVLRQQFTEEKSGLMTWLRSYNSLPYPNSTRPKLLVERIGLFPSSGNIRCAVRSAIVVLEHLRTLYANRALDVDSSDGLSLTFNEWRFKISLLDSPTEIILNVESRGDIALMQRKTAEILAEIDQARLIAPNEDLKA